MATMLSVTITAPAAGVFGEKRVAERQRLKQALQLAAQAIGDGTSLSGTIDVAGAAGCGTWTYTPTAAT